MGGSLTVADTVLVTAHVVSSGSVWASAATVIGAALGAAAVVFGVLYTQRRQAANLLLSQQKQLDAMLLAQRQDKLLERELEAVQDAYSTVYWVYASLTTLSVDRLQEEAEAYQMNIRLHRLYLPEDFVRRWRKVHVLITERTAAEKEIASGATTDDVIHRASELRQRLIPDALLECRRVLLESQGRPVDEIDRPFTPPEEGDEPKHNT